MHDFQIVAINNGKVRIRSNKGPVVLTVSGTVKVSDEFVKQCSVAIKALIEAKMISLNKVIVQPTVVQTSPDLKPPVVRTSDKKSSEGKSVFPGKPSKTVKNSKTDARQRIK